MAPNPPVVPPDTDPQTWRLQMEAIKRRPVADRLAEWEQLNRGVNRMVADAIRHRHPGYSDHQVFLAFVRAYHGDEIALEVWPEAASVAP